MTALVTLVARLRTAARRWEATPAELAALAALLFGGLLLLGTLWWLTPGTDGARADGARVDGDPAGDAGGGGLEGAGAADGRVDHDEAGAADGRVDHDEAGAADGALGLATEDVVVHVTGAVQAPGLHEVPGGARIADAIAAAGGPTDDAVLDGVNLARPVRDGEQLMVPDREMVEAAGGAPAAAGVGGLGGPGGAAVRPDGRLDLNRADAAALESLPGVGPVLAQRIESYRDAHGPFAQPEDLLDVSGIGERTYEALADLVDT